MFQCIYCHKSEPEVKSSESHIFPDAMGGATSSSETVCHNCNNLISGAFEQREIENFRLFQFMWGVKSRKRHGKRRKSAGIDGTIICDGREYKTSIDDNRLPQYAPISFEGDNKGDRNIHLLGPPELTDKKKKEIQKKLPEKEWFEGDLKNPEETLLQFIVKMDLDRPTVRRLAAKIAFEYWASIRNSELLIDNQYNTIREFILNGVENEVRCGVLSDPRLLKIISVFPPGSHFVALFAKPNSPILGAFISFYGLFYYWVILSKAFVALSSIDNILVEYPTMRQNEEPHIKTGVGDLFIPWDALVSSFTHNRKLNIEQSLSFAMHRMDVVRKSMKNNSI